MASTLNVKGRTTEAAARQASGRPLHRVKQRRVPDTLDAATRSRPWPGLRSWARPEVSLRIQAVEVMT